MYKPLGFKKPLILSIVIALFLVLLLLGFYKINSTRSDGYKKLSQEFNYEDKLIKYVIPNKKYTYWAFCRNLDSDTVIYSFGKKPKGIKLESPILNGLFVGCLPVMCSKYIAYVDNGKVYYVENAEEFKVFLGAIDNLQEAVLLARVEEDLQVDENDMRGGAFLIKSDSIYNLRLMRYISCPETEQSVYLKIEKHKGITDTSTLNSYYKGKGCIVY